MYLHLQSVVRRLVIVALAMMFGVWGTALYSQDAAAQQDSTSSPQASPVIPANGGDENGNGNKDVAKAGPLPATDTPSPRVATVRPDTYIVGVGDILEVN